VLGVDFPVEDRHIIIVEDIIDSGNTLSIFLPQLMELQPASVSVASFLLKPDALKHDLEIDYIGYKIPPKFVIGYGLDYNGAGRNLPGIYQLAAEKLVTDVKA